MFFPKIGLSEEEFFAKFLSIRESYLKGEYNSQKHVAVLARVCDGLTMNMDWIHLFSWRLPSADPSRKTEYIRVAKMFLAAFYIERLYKLRENPPLPDPADSSNVFTKLEALFSLTFEEK